ncbi:MAG: hypothetical protein ACLQD9_04080 [Thermoplasmata archaeon]
MSDTTSAGGSGAVLLIAVVILLQQLGYVPLTDFLTSIVLLLVAGIAGGIVFGLIAWVVGRKHH